MVAVEYDPCAEAAVEWAAAEASVRNSPLVVVHASRPLFACDLMGFCAAIPAQALAEQRVLRRAQDCALGVASDLEVLCYVAPGAPARVLPAESREAALLVLGWGSGRPRRPGRALAARVLAAASCPVVVVRPDGREPRRTQPRVVVGVDGAPPSAFAVGFAFRAAHQRGVPLVAVHAWRTDAGAHLDAVRGGDETAQTRAGELLDRALASWRRGFPDVLVERRIVAGDPAIALVREAHGAALVVVGTQCRPTWRRPPKSVSRRVVWHASSPVAVVRPDAPASRQIKSSAARRRSAEVSGPGRARQER